jgi:hypothetical protein
MKSFATVSYEASSMLQAVVDARDVTYDIYARAVIYAPDLRAAAVTGFRGPCERGRRLHPGSGSSSMACRVIYAAGVTYAQDSGLHPVCPTVCHPCCAPSSTHGTVTYDIYARGVINGGRHLSGAPPCRQPAIASRPPACDSPPRISSFAVKAHNRPGWVQGACWCCPTAGPASGSGDPGRNRFKSNSRQHGDP